VRTVDHYVTVSVVILHSRVTPALLLHRACPMTHHLPPAAVRAQELARVLVQAAAVAPAPRLVVVPAQGRVLALEQAVTRAHRQEAAQVLQPAVAQAPRLVVVPAQGRALALEQAATRAHRQEAAQVLQPVAARALRQVVVPAQGRALALEQAAATTVPLLIAQVGLPSGVTTVLLREELLGLVRTLIVNVVVISILSGIF
jgi:adenosyl cobinamide kinase/adenosyl cobinamide phosphate guanylyltransferase